MNRFTCINSFDSKQPDEVNTISITIFFIGKGTELEKFNFPEVTRCEVAGRLAALESMM